MVWLVKTHGCRCWGQLLWIAAAACVEGVWWAGTHPVYSYIIRHQVERYWQDGELQSPWPGINLYWPGQVWCNIQWLLAHIMVRFCTKEPLLYSLSLSLLPFTSLCFTCLYTKSCSVSLCTLFSILSPCQPTTNNFRGHRQKWTLLNYKLNVLIYLFNVNLLYHQHYNCVPEDADNCRHTCLDSGGCLSSSSQLSLVATSLDPALHHWWMTTATYSTYASHK